MASVACRSASGICPSGHGCEAEPQGKPNNSVIVPEDCAWVAVARDRPRKSATNKVRFTGCFLSAERLAGTKGSATDDGAANP